MTDLRERVATGACAIIAREVRCGQSPDAPADDPCKVTWLPYKRDCPECTLHHTQRMDVAREIADAAISLCREHYAWVVTDRLSELAAVGCEQLVEDCYRDAERNIREDKT